MVYVRFVNENTLEGRQSAEKQVMRLMKKTNEKVYKIIYTGDTKRSDYIKKLKKESVLKRNKPFWVIVDESKFLAEVEGNSALKIVDSFIDGELKETSIPSGILEKEEEEKVTDDEGNVLTTFNNQEKSQVVKSCEYEKCAVCRRIGFALLEKEKTQVAIAKELGVTQQAISKHITKHFPEGIIQGKNRAAYCKLTPEQKDFFTDLKEDEEAEVITERKLRNMRYDVFTDSIFWSAVVLIDSGISVEDIRLSLNEMTDEKDIRKSLVNAFRVLTVDNIIQIGSEEEDWKDGEAIKKWEYYTPNKIHTLNEENINQINSKRIRVLDEDKLKKYHLIGILINAVRGRTNLLDYWMNDFIKIFTERTEYIRKKVMNHVEEKLKNEDNFTDEDKRKAIILSKVIKGELFNAGFLERYMKPNNPEGIYFRDIAEINKFLGEIGAEFEFVASNPGEKHYLRHKSKSDEG